MPEFYTWVILLIINQIEQIGEKQLSVFGFRGDKAKIRTQQYIKLNTGAKKNPTGKPLWA